MNNSSTSSQVDRTVSFESEGDVSLQTLTLSEQQLTRVVNTVGG